MTSAAVQQPAPVPLPAPVVGSLSPSRAADFKTCPLLYRFRSVDRIPQRPTRDKLRGTLVHAVLDRLFDLPAAERTYESAAALVEPEWRRLADADPETAALFPDSPTPDLTAADLTAADLTAAGSAAGTRSADPASGDPTSGGSAAIASASVDPTAAGSGAGPADAAATDGPELAGWLDSARRMVAGYFALEDPSRLEPAAREQLVEAVLAMPLGRGDPEDADAQLLALRGYVDRLDVAPTGEVRVVDYKTGGIPRVAYEAKALFQLKFYALVLWRIRGTVPHQLKLMYLSDRDTLTYQPDAAELERFERTLVAVWRAIERAVSTRDFRPNPSRLCGWCDYQALCPSLGGTLPPWPEQRPEPPPAPEPVEPPPAGGPGIV